MSVMSVWAAGAGFAASGLLAIRAEMLSPGVGGACTAPSGVRAALRLLSVVMGLGALLVLRDPAAGCREALTYSAQGLAAAALFANLARQARR
jgi:hypothetical protein